MFTYKKKKTDLDSIEQSFCEITPSTGAFSGIAGCTPSMASQ